MEGEHDTINVTVDGLLIIKDSRIGFTIVSVCNQHFRTFVSSVTIDERRKRNHSIIVEDVPHTNKHHN
jgi:hypothetical protein